MQERISNWGVGINLGNALDYYRECTEACEPCWDNPITTREMIRMYAAAGFDLLRIPVTWGPHMGEGPDYMVVPAWMARVEEVVRWALDEGMRVVLNTHHENSWLRPELAAMKDVLPRYAALWRQIALRFGGYDDHLVFQGLNEPRVEGGENEWYGATADVRASVNVLNHTFVSVVRATGGNNAKRWLCIPPVGAKPHPTALEGLIVPKDDHVIVTLHSYTPGRFVFSHNEETSTPYFTPEINAALQAEFDCIQDFQKKSGVPVMITEYGAVTKKIPGADLRNDLERANYTSAFLARAKELGIPAILWDNNYFERGDEFFGLFDRSNLCCNTPAVMDTIRNFRAVK